LDPDAAIYGMHWKQTGDIVWMLAFMVEAGSVKAVLPTIAWDYEVHGLK